MSKSELSFECNLLVVSIGNHVGGDAAVVVDVKVMINSVLWCWLQYCVLLFRSDILAGILVAVGAVGAVVRRKARFSGGASFKYPPHCACLNTVFLPSKL